jgi:hypothetical protein
MTRAFFTAAALTVSLSAFSPAAFAAPVYSPLTGSYYDYINRNLADTDYTTWNWEEARVDAEARSFMGRQGRLATITSAAEEQVLIDNWLADILYGQPWLGGFRLPGADPVTGWQWVSGEPFAYTNWRTGEPNNAGGNEYYLHYQSIRVRSVDDYDDYGWNDAPLGLRVGYFIEYAAPVPEPATALLLGLAGLAMGVATRRRR